MLSPYDPSLLIIFILCGVWVIISVGSGLSSLWGLGFYFCTSGTGAVCISAGGLCCGVVGGGLCCCCGGAGGGLCCDVCCCGVVGACLCGVCGAAFFAAAFATFSAFLITF